MGRGEHPKVGEYYQWCLLDKSIFRVPNIELDIVRCEYLDNNITHNVKFDSLKSAIMIGYIINLPDYKVRKVIEQEVEDFIK